MIENHNDAYPPGVKAVLATLVQNRVEYDLRIFNAPARSASQAADLLECPLGAIVKSLIFEGEKINPFLLVLVSGKNRADLEMISTLVGEKVRPAPPDKVIEKTAYLVGSVPPIGITGNFQTIIDYDLLQYETVWASAGADNTLVGLSSMDLLRMHQNHLAINQQSSFDKSIV